MAAAPCPAGGGQCPALATGVVAAKGGIAMRRIGVIVALGALLGMVGGLATASPALAGRGPKWEIVEIEPFTLPAEFCGFEVGVNVPVNKEYSKELKTPEGVVAATLTTGSLRASFTNLETGKTITENISGPLKTTVSPDGSAVVAFKGLTALFLEPAQAKQFGLPIVSVTAGALTVSVDPNGIFTSVSLQGHVQVDICAALS
jgi:hypothetical protein